MTCPYAHTACRNGVWTRGANDQLGIVSKSNGQLEIKSVCLNCGTKSGALPQTLVREWKITAADLSVMRVHDRRSDYPACSVHGCTELVTELHHFAPRNTFGNSSDDWPVLPLCRPHHVEWHQRMDGYRWTARRQDVVA